ncbi:STAS domain-containing protein [Ectothiorhodospiraceae bacterium 2226]|nr:STAS domain-containing protein [Ectothiorhodospiraceae bacterium 2226]
MEALGEGRFRVTGALAFDTVPALLQASEPVLSGAGPWRIDLAGVAQADSAGLALLLRWMRRAAAAGTRARYENMPPQMRAIAAASGLEELLGEA